MTLQEIKAIARTNGMTVRNMKKENIIRTVQRIEGNTSCFATDTVKECGQKTAYGVSTVWKTEHFNNFKVVIELSQLIYSSAYLNWKQTIFINFNGV